MVAVVRAASELVSGYLSFSSAQLSTTWPPELQGTVRCQPTNWWRWQSSCTPPPPFFSSSSVLSWKTAPVRSRRRRQRRHHQQIKLQLLVSWWTHTRWVTAYANSSSRSRTRLVYQSDRLSSQESLSGVISTIGDSCNDSGHLSLLSKGAVSLPLCALRQSVLIKVAVLRLARWPVISVSLLPSSSSPSDANRWPALGSHTGRQCVHCVRKLWA